MNSTVRAVTTICVVAVAIWFVLINQHPCRSQSMLGKTYDFIMLIETEQEKNEFDYRGTLIGPVVKAKVTYYRPDQPDTPAIHYENLWFHDFQSLGCRRLSKLDLGNGGSVAIEVKHKQGLGSLSEAAAAAKAILRVFVDVYATKHAVSTMIVPDESMGYILNLMPQAGFNPGPEARPEVPIYSPIVIPIRSTSGSQKSVLYYTEPPGSGDDGE